MANPFSGVNVAVLLGGADALVRPRGASRAVARLGGRGRPPLPFSCGAAHESLSRLKRCAYLRRILSTASRNLWSRVESRFGGRPLVRPFAETSASGSFFIISNTE